MKHISIECRKQNRSKGAISNNLGMTDVPSLKKRVSSDSVSSSGETSSSPRNTKVILRTLLADVDTLKEKIQRIESSVAELLSEKRNSPRAKAISRLEASVGNYRVAITHVSNLSKKVDKLMRQNEMIIDCLSDIESKQNLIFANGIDKKRVVQSVSFNSLEEIHTEKRLNASFPRETTNEGERTSPRGDVPRSNSMDALRG